MENNQFSKFLVNYDDIFCLLRNNFCLDCNDCYNDILAAATECILSFDWKNCIEDILGGGSDCIECVCQVIGDIGNIFGQDWHC